MKYEELNENQQLVTTINHAIVRMGGLIAQELFQDFVTFWESDSDLRDAYKDDFSRCFEEYVLSDEEGSWYQIAMDKWTEQANEYFKVKAIALRNKYLKSKTK